MTGHRRRRAQSAAVGLAEDAQAAIAFIFILPLQVFLVAAAGWRLLRPR